ncbi:hypothetical protein AGMMS49936_00050 [Endomicrobiia bacterium]|nr:hypothetical protein AGMMS49936_00050 [Endomicrobiia bacterium]
MKEVKFLGKHKRTMNMLVILAMFTCTNVCLGISDIKGESVSRDDKKTIDQIKKSAEQGYAYAQCNLGGMYHEGKGVKQDYKEAINWFKKSAEQGFAQAQYNLGVMYYEGKGVKQDYKEAFNWFKKQHNRGILAPKQY